MYGERGNRGTGSLCLRGLANWNRLCDIALGDAPQPIVNALEQNLRESQAKSFKFLWDWWNSRYHDQEFAMAAKEYFRTSVLSTLQASMNP